MNFFLKETRASTHFFQGKAISLPSSLSFALFALSTPVGILVGGGVAGQIDGHDLLLARATVLAMAAGTFLFMGTLNDLQSAPLIQRCRHWRSFIAMLAGLAVTVCARLLIGDAHSLG